jgi:hypothetical protein
LPHFTVFAFTGATPVKTKKYKVIGGWRRLFNEALGDFYFSPNIIRVMKFGNVLSGMNKTHLFLCCHHMNSAIGAAE